MELIISGSILGGILYFLPSIIAILRRKRNGCAIILLNFFLGWTIIGWVIALVWSVMHEKADD